MKKFIALLAALVLLAIAPAHASQNTLPCLPLSGTYSGLNAANFINGCDDSLASNFSGTAAPGTPITYQFWADTSNSLFKVYDGTNWLPVGKFSSSRWVPLSSGVLSVAPVSTGSANAYVVTQAPVIAAYVTGQHYSFLANFTNSGSATADFGPGAKTIKKNGTANIASGDIISGMAVDLVYDGTNLQMQSQIGNPASGGTVTSIATGTGLTGGPVTTSGTILLADIANNTVLGNVSGSTGTPGAITPSQVLQGISTTQGTILYYNGSNWVALSPGSSGQLLQTSGAGANPSWVTLTNTSPLKAWVNFDGGTCSPNCTIRGSLNVSTVTKNGTGDYTINYSPQLSSANYMIFGSMASAFNNTVQIAAANNTSPPTLMTTTQTRVTFRNVANNATDCAYCQVGVIAP